MGSIVRFAALAAAAFVVAGFALFAIVELRDSADGQIHKLDNTTASPRLETAVQRPDPEPAVERVREKNHSAVREGIDDVNDVLLSPFSSFTDFESVWGERFLALILGLLLYGGGGMMLANFFPKQGHPSRDWREATG